VNTYKEYKQLQVDQCKPESGIEAIDGPDLRRFGHYLVQIWSLFGPDFVTIWSRFGHYLVQYGHYLIQVWSLFGPDLVTICVRVHDPKIPSSENEKILPFLGYRFTPMSNVLYRRG
jgi:hypothetical protein